MVAKSIQSDVMEWRKSTKTDKITVFATFAGYISIRLTQVIEW